MTIKSFACAGILFAASGPAFAQNPTPVTIDNFARAESDLYMGRTVKDGGFGKLIHSRTPTEIDKQKVIRMNRDTLYSSAVFDLDAAPVTVTLPDAKKRFMSMQVINEDHYAPIVVYAQVRATLTKDNVGTRYVIVAVRTLVDPADPRDLAAGRIAFRTRSRSSQKNTGKFEIPNWDQASQTKVRDALLVLGASPAVSRTPSARKRRSIRSAI